MKHASIYVLVQVALFLLINSTLAQEKSWKAAKLKTAPTSFGKLTESGGITADGKFNDTAKVYEVIDEKDKYVKLSDGTQSGWVIKTSLTQVEGSRVTAPAEPDLVKSGKPSQSSNPMIGKEVFYKDAAIAMVGSTVIDKNKHLAWPAVVEEVTGEWLWLSRAWVQKKHVMELDEAFDYCVEKVKREPDNAEAWKRRAGCWTLKGELRNAITDYDEAIRLDAKDATAFINRGLAKSDLKDYSGAKTDYDEAIRLDPKLAKAFNGRGIAKHYLRDYSGAIIDYDEAIRLDPKFAKAFSSRGIAKHYLQDYSGAIADYDEGIRLNPKLATTYYNRGLAKFNLDDNRGAITDYDEAIRLNLKIATAYYNRGLAKHNLKDYSGAISDYDEVIRLDPKYFNAYNSRGWDSLLIGKFPNAIKDFDECVRLDPKSLNPINNQSLLLSSCPDQTILKPDRALELAQQAEQIDPESGYTLNALSCAYAANDDFDKAIEFQEKALQVEDWKKDEGIDGGVLAQERLKKWRAKEQWSFVISQ